jgi:hypothetical protein
MGRRRLPPSTLVTRAMSLLAACLSVAHPAPAFELKTHSRISEAAYQRSVLSGDYLERELGLPPGTLFRPLFGLPQSPETLIREGSRREDDLNLISQQPVRVRHHFYDPLHDRPLSAPHVGGLGFRAPDWALEMPEAISGQDFSWRDARRSLRDALTAEFSATREREMARTFLTLGHVIHLIQDMAVPEHTRNDWHAGLVPPLFPAGTPSIFEGHINRTVDGFLLAGYPPPRFDRLRDFWATGDGRGLAEFTNRNFVSKDTTFETFEEGAVGRDRRTGHVYASPQLHLALREDADITTLHDPPRGLTGLMTFFLRHVDDRVTGEVHEKRRMVSLSLFDAALTRRGAQPIFTVNRYTVEDAASLLLPRAVGYSAALLDHFFRGRLGLDFDPEPASEDLSILTIRNRSTEPLGPGTLSLYVDDADGRRTPVPGTTVQVSGLVAPEQPITSLAVQRTLEGQRLTAVYEGRLGEEEGAVVGKVRQGVEVEQIFRGANDWMLRTADGVFPLGLGSDPHIVKWGDRDNTLLAQTFLGGRNMLLQAYRINRAEGSRRVPLKPGPTPLTPVVDLAPLGPSVTLGRPLDLGTRVTYTRSEDYTQHLVTVKGFLTLACDPEDPRKCWTVDHGITGAETSTPFSQVFGFTRSFPLVMDPELPFDAPFSWFLNEVFLNRDGDILGLLEVRLTTPPFIRVPIWRHNGPRVEPSGIEATPVVLFSPSPHVFTFVVNLTQGRVVAKSSEDFVSLTFRTVNHLAAADVEILVSGPGGSGPQWYQGNLTGTDDPGGGNVLGTFESRSGSLQWGTLGLHRPEFAAAGFLTAPRIAARTTSLPTAVSIYAPPSTSVPSEFREKSLGIVQNIATDFDVDPTNVLAITDVVRSSGPDEGYTILGWWDSMDVERWRPFQWYPLSRRLTPLAGIDLPANLETFVSLLGANQSAALLRAEVTLQPSRERVRTTRLVTPSREIVLTGDVTSRYRLLEPHWLYGVDDLRFHRLDAGLTALSFPRPLVAGPRFGAYHIVGGR